MKMDVNNKLNRIKLIPYSVKVLLGSIELFWDSEYWQIKPNVSGYKLIVKMIRGVAIEPVNKIV